MKKTLLACLWLLSLSAFSQDFQWQWAKRGGGLRKTATESDIAYGFNSEQILDIAVDNQNNYYFLAFLTEQATEYDGAPLTTYNTTINESSGTDIVLISTDCSGTLRWTQTIGGGTEDDGYHIVLDNNGGLYLSAYVLNFSGFGLEYEPPHFSPTDSMPATGPDYGQPQQGWKTGAILKYNTADGSLAWRTMPQGDVNQTLRVCNMSQIALHADGTLSALVGFQPGVHANGLVAVSETDVPQYNFKHYILRLDANGNIFGAIDLHMQGYLLQNHTDFRYDENLQRYYVSGFGTNGDIFQVSPLSVNGVALSQQAFILAFTHTGQEIWRKESSSTSQFQDNRIYDLKTDADSNIYICGKFFGLQTDTVALGDFQIPVTTEGNTAYVLKMNPAGNVLWFKAPTAYNAPYGIFTGSHFMHHLVLHGDEIAVAAQADTEIWDGVSVNRPPNHRADPALLRLNKNTGTAIGLHDIMGQAGYDDGLTAVAVDKDGNYVVGGYMYADLFTLANDNVPTIHKVQNAPQFTDFFMAKLAASPCGSLGQTDFESNKTRIYPNPAKSFVTIETDETLESYEIASVLGQVLASGNINAQKAISVEGLGNGIYILNLRTKEKGSVSFKIVKE